MTAALSVVACQRCPRH